MDTSLQCVGAFYNANLCGKITNSAELKKTAKILAY